MAAFHAQVISGNWTADQLEQYEASRHAAAEAIYAAEIAKVGTKVAATAKFQAALAKQKANVARLESVDRSVWKTRHDKVQAIADAKAAHLSAVQNAVAAGAAAGTAAANFSSSLTASNASAGTLASNTATINNPASAPGGTDSPGSVVTGSTGGAATDPNSFGATPDATATKGGSLLSNIPTPYLIGGGVLVAGVGLLIVFKRRRV